MAYIQVFHKKHSSKHVGLTFNICTMKTTHLPHLLAILSLIMLGSTTPLNAETSNYTMPNGLYYAGKDGYIRRINNAGEITTYDIEKRPHTFQLLHYNGRIYGASAGKKTGYSPAENGGDGKLFTINSVDGHVFQTVMFDNTDGHPHKDPQGVYQYGGELYVTDRNVCIRKISADVVGVSQSHPSWLENNWLGYYGHGISYAAIKAGFTITEDPEDNQPLYWLGIRFNGQGIWRFKESDISETNPILPNYEPIFQKAALNFSTFYIDEKHNHLYIYFVDYGRLYRFNLDELLANPNPQTITALNPVIIDDSPILSEGPYPEEVGISQLSPDENGEHLYWCYNAPKTAEDTYHGTNFDATNPMHQSGIKRIKLGEANPVVEIVVSGVEGYGVVAVNYHPGEPDDDTGISDIQPDSRLQVMGDRISVADNATIRLYAINGALIAKTSVVGRQTLSLNHYTKGIYIAEALFADGTREVAKVAVR